MSKRRIGEICHDFAFEPDDLVSLSSVNFSGFVVGFRSGASRLSIIRSRKYHQFLKVVKASEKSFYLEAYNGPSQGMFMFVDPDSRDLLLSVNRTLFVPEVIDTVGSKQVIRLATRERLYIRHSNYLLSADPPNDRDNPWAEDSQWLMSRICVDDVSTAPSTPLDIPEAQVGFNRPLFIHVEECFADPATAAFALRELRGFIEGHITNSTEKPRIGLLYDELRTVSYPLQGAGGMGMSSASATAISMHRPGPIVPDPLRHRIEEATTVKSRGGIRSFVRPSQAIEPIVDSLARKAVKEMKRLRMFGMTKRRDFELTLGFVEWVSLPHDCEITPHRDGGNDCDVAAIVSVSNEARCTVEGTTIVLKPGQMYIFEPQKYLHSVGKPLFDGPRHVMALRFFRCS